MMGLRDNDISAFLKLSLTAALAVILGACDAPATEPVPTFGDVELDVAAYENPTAQLRYTFLNEQPGLSLDEVYVVLDEIDLVPESGQDADIDWLGPVVARLVHEGQIVNEIRPYTLQGQLPAGVYTKLIYRLRPITAEEIPAEWIEDPVAATLLPGRSIVAQGRLQELETEDWNGNGLADEVSFRFLTPLDSYVGIATDNGFLIEAATFNHITIAFPLDEWFAGLEESLITIARNGVGAEGIVLDAGAAVTDPASTPDPEPDPSTQPGTDPVTDPGSDPASDPAAVVSETALILEDSIVGSGQIAVSGDTVFEPVGDVDETSISYPAEDESGNKDKDKEATDIANTDPGEDTTTDMDTLDPIDVAPGQPAEEPLPAELPTTQPATDAQTPDAEVPDGQTPSALPDPATDNDLETDSEAPPSESENNSTQNLSE